MAKFASNYKRAFLRRLWAAKDEDAKTLLEILNATLRGKVATTEDGFLISSTSGAGQSTQFHIPQNTTAGLTPQNLAELCDELIEVYEDCQRYLDTDDESLIYTEMKSRLRAVRSVRQDFSAMGVFR